MKKVLFPFACILMFASCAYKPMPLSSVNIIDYSSLTKNGIYVTESNSVSFEYTAIGSIYMEEIGGYVRKDGKSTSSDPKESYYLDSSKNMVYLKPDVQKMFENLISQLNQSGANGIINLNIEHSIVPHILNKNIYVDRITITGMAIKK